MQLCQVYADARRAGARIYAYNIGFTDAATIEWNGAYGIFVDVSRPRDWRQLSWQLAHEVGHCATGCTHKLSSPYDLIARHEYKADRWAITRYLGVEALRRAMAAGCTEPWQLAEYFDLPQSAVEQALHYWVDCRGVDFNALPEDGPAPDAAHPWAVWPDESLDDAPDDDAGSLWADAGGGWDAAGQDAGGSQAAAPCEELPFRGR